MRVPTVRPIEPEDPDVPARHDPLVKVATTVYFGGVWVAAGVLELLFLWGMLNKSYASLEQQISGNVQFLCAFVVIPAVALIADRLGRVIVDVVYGPK